MSNTLAAFGMIMIDIIIIICFFIIIKLNVTFWSRKVRILGMLEILLFFLLYVTFFVVEYNSWHNINAAVFKVINPSILLTSSVVYLFVFLIIHRWIESKSFRGIFKKTKIVHSSIVSLMLLVTLFICPFIEVFLNNLNQFSFSLFNVIVPILSGMIIGIGLVVLVCALLNNKAYMFLMSLLFSIGLMSYIQGIFLNGTLFLMDGKEMEWPASLILGNLCIWITICFLIIRIIKLTKISKYTEKIIVYVALFVTLIQLIGIMSLIPNVFSDEDATISSANNYLSEQGIEEIASDNNIIVFVLDTYDVDYFEEVLEQNAKFYSPLTDFVFYPDTVSQFSRTYPSIPYMLSHEMYFFEEPKKEYVDCAFSSCDFWTDLKEINYSIYIYEDDRLCIGETLLSECNNFIEEGHVLKEDTSFFGSIKAIVTVGGYRTLPYLVKSSLSYTADSINKMVISEKIWDNKPYEMNDSKMLEAINNSGLTISDEESAFRFIHLMGAHAPYILDISGKEVDNRIVDPVEQYQGCMQYVYRYIDELKKLGKYENSTIIITADHGENFVANELPNNTNPILLIKYPDCIGEVVCNDYLENGPKVSYSKASLEDILPTIGGILNVNYSGNGVNLREVVSNDRIRYHYFAVVEDTKQTGTLKYEINGSSRNFDCWENTGEYHKFGDYYE